jgi:hypothetical protein
MTLESEEIAVHIEAQRLIRGAQPDQQATGVSNYGTQAVERDQFDLWIKPTGEGFFRCRLVRKGRFPWEFGWTKVRAARDARSARAVGAV